MGTNTSVKFWKTIIERDDISWIGPANDAMGFCFGTETGDVIWTDFDGKSKSHFKKVASLGEPINGVAFNAGQMCVTTRNETSFLFLSSQSENTSFGGTIAGGAHGVVAGRSGDFFIPRGIAGFLNVRKDSPSTLNGCEIAPQERDMYFYEIASLATAEGEQVLACALRKNGLAMARYKFREGIHFTTFKNGQQDHIDICSAGIPTMPLAAYALTKDGTIYPFHNVLTDRNPYSLRFPSVQGTAYRILASGDFVFVLTSRALHVIHKLLVNDNGLLDDNRDSRMLTIPLEAVDMNLVGDRWLLVLLTDRVERLDLELLKQTLPDFPIETSDPETPGNSEHFVFNELTLDSHKLDHKLLPA